MTLVELLVAGNSYRDRCLIALHHAAQAEGTDSLSTGEIGEQLRRARVPKATKINVSDVLGKAGSLVDAAADEGRGRRWWLTTSGVRYVEDLLLGHFGLLPQLGGISAESTKQIAEVRLLFLGVSPTDAMRLRLDQEHREIQERIRAAEYRDSIRFESGWAVRPDDMFQLMHEHKPHIVHFSGHGSNLNQLAFEDAQGKSKPVTGEALAKFFETMHDEVRLVVLNACHSADAASQISAYIECTVGMTDAINDQTAIQFSAAFYRAIGFGKSVDRAFREARASLVLAGLPDDSVPQLYTRTGVDADAEILAYEIGANG